MRVSSVAVAALASAPSLTWARPARPAIGARTSAWSSCNLARATAACASCSAASAWRKPACADSNSCTLTALRCTNWASRARSAEVCARAAWAEASEALACCSRARRSRGSIWNRGAFAATVVPSTYNCCSMMPSARARTSTERPASTRPGSSTRFGTTCACTTSTSTSVGGRAPPGALPLRSHAASSGAVSTSQATHRRVGIIVTSAPWRAGLPGRAGKPGWARPA